LAKCKHHKYFDLAKARRLIIAILDFGQNGIQLITALQCKMFAEKSTLISLGDAATFVSENLKKEKLVRKLDRKIIQIDCAVC
jgi:hypothetical protein